MKSSFVLSAGAVRTLGIAMVVAGFVGVLVFVCQALTGVALLPHAPQIPAAWLEASAARLPFALRNWMPRALPPGFVFAVVSFAAMLLGAAVVRRQMPALEAAQRDSEDRMRRAREYARDVDADGRIEPYIGADVTFIDVEPTESCRFVNDERSSAPDSARSPRAARVW